MRFTEIRESKNGSTTFEGGMDNYKKIRASRSVSRQLMPNGLFHPRE